MKPEHQGLATEVMCRMNIAGASFANIEGVKAMTDVTGFGLLGHLSEMCQGLVCRHASTMKRSRNSRC
ncbi:AIR synthase-related protein [Escherichia coli]